jgi:hypothetical protein
MIDLIETLYIGLAGIVGVLAALLIGYTRFAGNKAKLLRQITSKNYGVVALRGRGGHTKYYIHDFDKVTFEYGPTNGRRTFLIKQDVNYDRIGSAPLIYFNIDDANPITFNATGDKKVAPENLNSIFMLLKAWIEAGAALTQNKMFLIVVATLILVIIGLALSYNAGSVCGGVGGKVDILIQNAKIVIPSPEPFKLT